MISICSFRKYYIEWYKYYVFLYLLFIFLFIVVFLQTSGKLENMDNIQLLRNISPRAGIKEIKCCQPVTKQLFLKECYG